ncbi:uncharacterized protein LOC142350660 [Convolutriloba macropyga]|uniref:uncharacterized protein LOC142350660 n=1 Tax=Convolutriloba macropyga TaxID=536237 RepID=UPI003F52187A
MIISLTFQTLCVLILCFISSGSLVRRRNEFLLAAYQRRATTWEKVHRSLQEVKSRNWKPTTCGGTDVGESSVLYLNPCKTEKDGSACILEAQKNYTLKLDFEPASAIEEPVLQIALYLPPEFNSTVINVTVAGDGNMCNGLSYGGCPLQPKYLYQFMTSILVPKVDVVISVPVKMKLRIMNNDTMDGSDAAEVMCLQVTVVLSHTMQQYLLDQGYKKIPDVVAPAKSIPST